MFFTLEVGFPAIQQVLNHKIFTIFPGPQWGRFECHQPKQTVIIKLNLLSKNGGKHKCLALSAKHISNSCENLFFDY